ncbi:4'-phosphopantetheinyl transferase superfamily protein [Streptomyces sp. NPDC094049]|uniref:type I polyketide synthase n=1 Tax=Streptomyces sp. NPDC094049 TaxID=3154987 RepID=UPI003329C09F
MTRCSDASGTEPTGPAARLERVLGPPYDGRYGGPPLGTAALAAQVLRHELVPAARGGRMTRRDTAAVLLRAVARRDLLAARAHGAGAAARTGVPGSGTAAVGSADSALRAVLGAVLAGHGGVRPLTSRWTRTAVTGAFADLLAADALVLAAVRGGHLLPGSAAPWTAAADHLAPRLLRRSTGDLLGVLGTGWLRQERRHGAFHRHLRALDTTGAGGTGPPAVPPVAAESALPPGLFIPNGPLPPLNPPRPASGPDPLPAALHAAARQVTRAHPPALRSRLALLATAFAELGRERRDPRREGAQGERYALLASAAACAGVWASAVARPDAGFLAHPAWLLVALDRAAVRLGLGLPDLRPEDPEPLGVLLAEAVTRVRRNHSLDLYAVPLAGHGARAATAAGAGAPARPRRTTPVPPVTPGPPAPAPASAPGPAPLRASGPGGPWTGELLRRMDAEGHALLYGYADDWATPVRTASRAFLAHAAAVALRVGPDVPELSREPGGKPYLRGFPGLELSLSHSGPVLVLGLSRLGRIGADTEATGRPVYGRPVTRDVFTAPERAALRRLPEGERNAAAVGLWTLKEAYGKAWGLGLRLPPGSFGFSVPGAATGSVALLHRPDGVPAAGRGWRFVTHRTPCGWTVSAAVSGAGPARVPGAARDGPGGRAPDVRTATTHIPGSCP